MSANLSCAAYPTVEEAGRAPPRRHADIDICLELSPVRKVSIRLAFEPSQCWEYQMRKIAFAMLLTLTTAIIAGSVSVGAQEKVVKRTELQRIDLPEMPGKEGVLYIGEFAPSATAPKHFHPGTEFIYVIEGAVTFERDGQPPLTLKAGESSYQLPKASHKPINANPGGSTKLVIFLISEKGQPLATNVE
jgi:quercetin dioxygenase-like cupin family protein